MEVRKDFGQIRAAYAFFEAHTDEMDANLQSYLDVLKGRPLPRLLDFGCGDGRLTERLVRSLGVRPAVTLVEPVTRSLDAAATRMRHCSVAVTPLYRLPVGGHWDVVLCNHVLYYVDDLEATVRRLLICLTGGAVLLATMAGRSHPLVQMWDVAWPEGPLPYHTSEDLEAVFLKLGQAFDRRTVHSSLTFDDTEENRAHIIQFVTGQEPTTREAELFSFFNAYVCDDGKIRMPNSDHLYVVRG